MRLISIALALVLALTGCMPEELGPTDLELVSSQPTNTGSEILTTDTISVTFNEALPTDADWSSYVSFSPSAEGLFELSGDAKTLSFTPDVSWQPGETYSVILSDSLTSAAGGAFTGFNFEFSVTDKPNQILTGKFEDWVYGRAIAFDSQGNMYAVGYINAATVLNGTTMPYDQNSLVAKYDITGNLVWAKTIESTDNNSATELVIDSQDNLYIAGSVYGNFYEITHSNTGLETGYVIAMDTDGNVLWKDLLDATPKTSTVTDLAVDSSDNLYVVGRTTGSVGATQVNYEDTFLARYNNSGVQELVAQYGPAGSYKSLVCDQLALSVSQNIYLACSTSGSFDGNAYVGGEFDTNAVVFKVNSSGDIQWSQQYGATGLHFYRTTIVVDSDGMPIAGFNYRVETSPTDFQGYALSGSDNSLLIKHDAAGTRQWTQLYQPDNWDSNWTSFTDLVIDNNDNLQAIVEGPDAEWNSVPTVAQIDTDGTLLSSSTMASQAPYSFYPEQGVLDPWGRLMVVGALYSLDTETWTYSGSLIIQKWVVE